MDMTHEYSKSWYLDFQSCLFWASQHKWCFLGSIRMYPPGKGFSQSFSFNRNDTGLTAARRRIVSPHPDRGRGESCIRCWVLGQVW